MATDARQSIVFHRAANALMIVAAVFAGYLFFALIIPAMEVELDSRSVSMAISTLYQPVLLMFLGSCAVVLAIVGWRAWLLYIRPWWRGPNGA
jgi:hypothetical protein